MPIFTRLFVNVGIRCMLKEKNTFYSKTDCGRVNKLHKSIYIYSTTEMVTLTLIGTIYYPRLMRYLSVYSRMRLGVWLTLENVTEKKTTTTFLLECRLNYGRVHRGTQA